MNNLLQREIITTEDGSHTLYVPDLEEHYHSIHGAIQESDHVFIRNGLLKCNKQKLSVLEIGFGTGLNVLLSLINKGEREITYFSLEKYPLTAHEYTQLNYPDFLPGNTREIFLDIHRSEWNKATEIVPGFQLTKLHADLTGIDFESLPCFDLIFFDAFAPARQPEMWQEPVFFKIAEHTSPSGIFVTYCARGEVRRALTRVGFNMKRIPGPPGKKEMLFGEKTNSCHTVQKNPLSS